MGNLANPSQPAAGQDLGVGNHGGHGSHETVVNLMAMPFETSTIVASRVVVTCLLILIKVSVKCACCFCACIVLVGL